MNTANGSSMMRWRYCRYVLSTCWPLDALTSGPLRYLVHAEMVDRIKAR